MSVCISVKDLHKTFKIGFFRKKIDVLRGISFEVQEGEVFGFLGPNGCGKTTTIKILLSLIFPSHGSVEVLGKSVKEVEFKNDVGFLPDSPYFYSYLNAEEFLHFYGQLFGLYGKACRKKIDSLLDLVGLNHARKLQLRKYSRGMLQRIGMAQALINDPKLVIMDEPLSGLDPIGRKQIRDIIIRLKDDKKTVFFSSHILSDVEMVCDRVAILVKGHIRGSGKLSELLQENIQSVDVCIKKDSNVSIEAIIKEFGPISEQDEKIFFNVSQDCLNPLIQKLVNVKACIQSVIPHKESLEDLFMSEIR